MKRNKLQENAPDPTGNTEHGWMWRIHCPSCSDPVVLAMPDSGIEENADASTEERRKRRANR